MACKIHFLIRLVFICLLLLIGSCGFKLRGQIELPPQFDVIYIDEDSKLSSISPALKSLLKQNKITIADKIESAKVIISVEGESYLRRILTVSSGGNVEEFELTYSVKYSVRQKLAESSTLKTLLKSVSVNLKRDLRFDENAVLAKATEENELKEDMLRAASEQIIRRLYKLKDLPT